MGFPQGFNFRSSAAFTVDGYQDQSVIEPVASNSQYPTTFPSGTVAGWEGDGTFIDGQNFITAPPKLAGHHYSTNLTSCQDFRVDLTQPGVWDINLGVGDGSYVIDSTITLFDTSTSLGTLSSGTTPAINRWRDALNTEFTSRALWDASQAPARRKFATTIARFRLGTVNSTRLCHLKIEWAPGVKLSYERFPEYPPSQGRLI